MNRKQILKFIICSFCISCAYSCGNLQFHGKNSTSNQLGGDAEETKSIDIQTDMNDLSHESVGQDTVTGGKVIIGPPTDQDSQSIAQCQKKWGLDESFQFQELRKIKVLINIGASGVTFKDNSVTEKPSLTLIYAAINVGGNPIWELKNPNGWYCIAVSVNVQTNLLVKIHENGQLADSTIAVDVGGQNEDTISTIGINVGSNISVETL